MEYKMATKMTAVQKRASDASIENLGKSFDKKLAARKKSTDKWRGRGASGEAELAKELAASQAVNAEEDRKTFDGLYIDMDNAERYGRDAYKSRDFGKPKTVGKLKHGGKTGTRTRQNAHRGGKDPISGIEKAVAVANDSKYEGKINPPKEPDGGVAKARMSRPTGPDRKEMAYNRRRSASEGRTVSKMSMGGKARGMGAATKGGSFSKNG
jgi:hypothetical protein